MKPLRLFMVMCLLWVGVLTTAESAYARLQTGGNPSTIPFVVSGVVTNQQNREQLVNFVDWLSITSGYRMHLEYARDYSDLSRILRENPHAIGWTCSAPFVEDHDRYGQQLVSIPLFKGQPTYHSVVLTQKGRSAQGLVDFRGEVLAYSDSRSNSGFVAPSVALKRQGIHIHSYFRLLLNAGSHEGSLDSVVTRC